MKFLVTGAAGFIGFHVAQRLLARGDTVVGLDNFNNYYDVGLKEARAALLSREPGFSLVRGDIEDQSAVDRVFAEHQPARVIHLAAQAGVRYSLKNPLAYTRSNVTGFLHVLEACRTHEVEHLVYASSSSVYGGNTKVPFSEHDRVDHPVSLYAATKKANELMAHTYSHLWRLPTTGLRFFTVYGPWGRPDMALFLFTRAIVEGRPIQVFNHGHMTRDFTYIDDIVEGILRVVDKAASPDADFDAALPDPASSLAPYRVFNIGNSQPTPLMTYIEEIERQVGRVAVREYCEIQPGDVVSTSADTTELEKWVGFKPSTPIEVGVKHFVEWYRRYYNVGS